jgi:hypothetical protein
MSDQTLLVILAQGGESKFNDDRDHAVNLKTVIV